MRVIKVVFILVFIFSLSACGQSQPEPRNITVSGDAEIKIAPDKVILAENQPAPRTVTVSGEAEVKVVPDEVILTLGVETWGKDVGAAKEENDKIVQRILALATKHGIEPQHIQTNYISVEPRYYDQYEKSKFIGFIVRKTIVVTLRNISKFEDFLTSVLEAGANYVHGVEFRTTELRKYRDEARALAIKAAQEKAIALAGELGQKVGEPLMIREDKWWAWHNGGWGARWSTSSQVSQSVREGFLSTESTVALGQISVGAKVTIEFELK